MTQRIANTKEAEHLMSSWCSLLPLNAAFVGENLLRSLGAEPGALFLETNSTAAPSVRKRPPRHHRAGYADCSQDHCNRLSYIGKDTEPVDREYQHA